MQEGEISTERQTENQTAKQPELPPEQQNNENKLLKFVKKNAVCCIAFCLALVTSFIVPPDKEYLGYFDFKTLACLFSVSAAVCALKGIRFFYIAARAIVQKFKNARACVIALVCVTFVGSMLIANDMALITFLPLGYLALSSTGKQKYMPFTFIMQNIAANLGGMLTPFGNPQNLYLYGKFNIPTGEFMLIMLPPFAFSVLAIVLCCIVFVKPESLSLPEEAVTLNKPRLAAYLALFAVSVLMVFRILPYYIGLAVVALGVFVLDRSALKKVDYALLFTFVFFFIFSGNMSRISAVRDLLSGLLAKNTLLVSVLSCQCISNVPSAILLSGFTGNYKALLLGVNIGHAHRLACQPYHAERINVALSRIRGKVPRYVFRVQFRVFNRTYDILLVSRVTKMCGGRRAFRNGLLQTV